MKIKYKVEKRPEVRFDKSSKIIFLPYSEFHKRTYPDDVLVCNMLFETFGRMNISEINPPMIEKLRNVSLHIASVLGSAQIVYVPCRFIKPEEFVASCTKVRRWKTWSIGFMKTVGQLAQTFESISPQTLRTSTTSTEPSIQILWVDFRGGLQGQWSAVNSGSQPNCDGSLDSSY